MHLFVKQSFFSRDPLRIWSLGYPRVQKLGWWDHTCVKNLTCVGVEDCAKFGGDWSGSLCVKEGYRFKVGTNSLFYIHR